MGSLHRQYSRVSGGTGKPHWKVQIGLRRKHLFFNYVLTTDADWLLLHGHPRRSFIFARFQTHTWKSDFTGIYLSPPLCHHHYSSQYSAKTSAQTFSKASCRLLSSSSNKFCFRSSTSAVLTILVHKTIATTITATIFLLYYYRKVSRDRENIINNGSTIFINLRNKY